MKQAELEKLHVEIIKLLAEPRKLNAEAGKMTRETFWSPVAIANGIDTMPHLRAAYRRTFMSIAAVLACAMSPFVTATTFPDAEASDPAKLG